VTWIQTVPTSERLERLPKIMERGRLPPGQKAVSAASFHQPPHLKSEARSCPSSTVSQDCTHERSVHLRRLAILGEPYQHSRAKRVHNDKGEEGGDGPPSKRIRSRITGDSSVNNAELGCDTASAGNTRRARQRLRTVHGCEQRRQRRVSEPTHLAPFMPAHPIISSSC
jgi:hypothetical protein